MDRDPSPSPRPALDDTLVSDDSDSKTPSQLARYHIAGTIGRGGMGEVVSARDEQIGRQVAIKRMRAEQASPEAVARFLREARIQGRLDHPAIVPVHELCESEGEPFFVMKQLSGVTLAAVIAGGAPGKFTREQLLRAFVDVCLAVEFAHTRGIVHRDLKPANIMLGDFGEVYVLDWGIARVVGEDATHTSFADVDTVEGEQTATGSVLGTPGYMSAEQVRGDDDLDGRGDVYALGCILFEILAGKPLHPRGHAGLASALAGVDTVPSAAAPERDVAPELDGVCRTATARERNDRYPSARALGDAVQRYLDGDRDLALRRELARGELARAKEALAAGDGADEHRDALRAAARALALDPHAREAAELVGRLMIEPPKRLPPELVAELDERDLAERREHAARGGRAMGGYVVCLSFFYAAGIRAPLCYALAAACVLGNVTVTYLVARHRRHGLAPLVVPLNAMLVLLIAYVTSPLLIAPGIAALTAAVIGLHPRLVRAHYLYLWFVAAVVLPWLGEVVGVLPRTIEIAGNAIVLHADASRLDPLLIQLGLLTWILLAPAVMLVLTRSSVVARWRLRRAMQVQAWQLRQLVPRA